MGFGMACSCGVHAFVPEGARRSWRSPSSAARFCDLNLDGAPSGHALPGIGEVGLVGSASRSVVVFESARRARRSRATLRGSVPFCGPEDFRPAEAGVVSFLDSLFHELDNRHRREGVPRHRQGLRFLCGCKARCLRPKRLFPVPPPFEGYDTRGCPLARHVGDQAVAQAFPADKRGAHAPAGSAGGEVQVHPSELSRRVQRGAPRRQLRRARGRGFSGRGGPRHGHPGSARKSGLKGSASLQAWLGLSGGPPDMRLAR
jgi:hypothetical protein